MSTPRFQISLRTLTDRRSLSLLSSISQAKLSSPSSSHPSYLATPIKKTFLLHQQHQTLQQQTNKVIKYTRQVSFDTIQFILSILSCVFSLLIIYTRNIDSEFLYNSISISTVAILIILVCKFFLAEKVFRLGQIVELIVYAVHPNVFTTGVLNGYLHILLLCRLHSVLKFMLRNRIYLNIRADRVVESNGSAPSGMVFALKAELMGMSSKTLVLIYGVLMLLLSHSLYITMNFEILDIVADAGGEIVTVEFVDCIFAVAETMTLIGFMDHFPSNVARVIAIVCLITGQCLNSTMILINVRSLTMNREQKNAHQLSKCLIQRQDLQKSAVKLLEFNHRYKNNEGMNHPSEYHKIALEIRANRKSLYKTTRGEVVENLSMTFMEGCYRLKEKTMLTCNYIQKVMDVLRRSKKEKAGMGKSVRFIQEDMRRGDDMEGEEEGAFSDSDENEVAIQNTEANRIFRRITRRTDKYH